MAVLLAGTAIVTTPSIFASAGSAQNSIQVAPSLPSTQFEKTVAAGPAKIPSPTPEPTYATVESPLSMDDPYPDFVPDQCPEGTVAGTVDANGNQSDCQPVSTESAP